MHKRHIANALLTTLLLAAFSSTIYLYIELKEAREQASTSQAVSPEETRQITSEISKFMRLPDNETPTVLKVNNANELRSQQQFFQYSQDGDRVLIYQQNRKAILYRPSQKKVIEVSPISFNQSEQASQQATQPEQVEVNPPQPKVAGAQSRPSSQQENLQITVYNANRDPLAYNQSIDLIRAKFSDLEINESGKANAQYNQNIVVIKNSASEIEKALGEQIAQLLNAQISQQAENEPSIARSSSNISVIIGSLSP